MVALRPIPLLLLGASIAFGLGLWAPFTFDDHLLLNDPWLSRSDGWTHVFDPTLTRPLTWLTFWVNRQISAVPQGFHLVNLLLHLAAVWMAARILPAVAGPVAGWLAAVVFALHPLQTEAIVYVFARAMVLATLLCLLAWWEWHKGRSYRALLWFALALLAKEEVVAFPLFLALVDEYRLSRWRPLTAMLLLSLVAGLRALWAANLVPGSGAGANADLSAWQYFSAQGGVILRYLGQVVLPFGLTVDPDPAVGPVWLWIFLLLSRGWLLAGILLLLPSSSIFPAQDLAADRRMYFAIAPIAAGIAPCLPRRSRRWLFGLAFILVALSMRQSFFWITEERLWTRAMELAPAKARPVRQLARLVPPETGMYLLRTFPDDALALNDLGRLYLQQQRPAEALAAFGRALGIQPNAPMYLNNRGIALLMLGQKDAAIGDFVSALHFDPCFADARKNLKQLAELVSEPPQKCGGPPFN